MPNTSVPAPETPSLVPPAGALPARADDSVSTPESDRSAARLALAGTCVGVIAVLALGIPAASTSIWMDEGYSLDTARRGWLDVVHHAFTFEFQPPLYFLTLHGWLALRDTVPFARLLSILTLCVAVVLAHAVGRRLGIRRWYANPALLLAALPFTHWAGTEIRTSAFTMACATLSMLAFAGFAAGDRPGGTRAAIALGASWLVALLSFYYLGFLLAGQALGAWLDKRLRLRLVLVAGAVGIAILPIVRMILAQKAGQEQMASVEAYSLSALSVGGVLGWARDFVFASFIIAPINENAPAYHVAVAVATLAFVAAAWVGGRRSANAGRTTLQLSLAAAVPVLVSLGFGLTHVAPTATRYCGAIAAAPVVILIDYAIDRTEPPRLAALMAALVFLVFGYSTVSYVRNRTPLEDWKGFAQSIATSRLSASEPVFVFESDAVLPLREYYDSTRIVALPRPLDLDRYTVESRRINSIAEIDTAVRSRVAPGQRFWIAIHDRAVATPGGLGTRILLRWIHRRTTTAAVYRYRAMQLHSLVLSPENDSIPPVVNRR